MGDLRFKKWVFLELGCLSINRKTRIAKENGYCTILKYSQNFFFLFSSIETIWNGCEYYLRLNRYECR